MDVFPSVLKASRKIGRWMDKGGLELNLGR